MFTARNIFFNLRNKENLRKKNLSLYLGCDQPGGVGLFAHENKQRICHKIILFTTLMPAGDRALSFHYVNICMKIYHKNSDML